MPALIDRTWLWFAAAFYLAGFVLGLVAMLRVRIQSRAWMYALVSAAFTFQTFGLYLRGLEVKGCPIGNTFEIFQFTAWSATALFLVIGPTFRLSLLGFFTSCLATAMTVVSLAFPSWDATRRVDAFGGNSWIEFHAALALFSYGVFALFALTSGMYLLQHYSLRSRRLNGLFSFLPSIRELDHIGLRLLTAGSLLISASLAVGSVYWLRDPESVQNFKLIITVAVALAYLVTLFLRWRRLLVAKRFAWVGLLLFAAALGSLWPVNSSRKPLPESPASHRS